MGVSETLHLGTLSIAVSDETILLPSAFCGPSSRALGHVSITAVTIMVHYFCVQSSGGLYHIQCNGHVMLSPVVHRHNTWYHFTSLSKVQVHISIVSYHKIFPFFCLNSSVNNFAVFCSAHTVSLPQKSCFIPAVNEKL